MQGVAIEPGRGTVVGRALLEGKTVHVRDIQADPEYDSGRSSNHRRLPHNARRPAPARGNSDRRSVLRRTEFVRSPTSRSSWSTTFADQAVIAIENVRLFDEVQARTRELTQSVEELRALGEVSQAVNSTLDLQTVLDTIVAKATQLSAPRPARSMSSTRPTGSSGYARPTE